MIRVKSNLLGMYTNGNGHITLLTDGTKIRTVKDDHYSPAFAESIDVKITSMCDKGCPWCFEGCTRFGKHADILHEPCVDTLHPYQEVAIGGGNVFDHPDLIPFLQKIKQRKAIANITVHQDHFTQYYELIKWLSEQKLIYGVGISCTGIKDNEWLQKVKSVPNTVIHVIAGVFDESMHLYLAGHGLKLLILGYKKLRRGELYYEYHDYLVDENRIWLCKLLEDKRFLKDYKVVGFDNLAVKQLYVQSAYPSEWEERYMGNDGAQTFYIDLVDRTFSLSSTESVTSRYPLLDNVDDMFRVIHKQ